MNTPARANENNRQRSQWHNGIDSSLSKNREDTEHSIPIMIAWRPHLYQSRCLQSFRALSAINQSLTKNNKLEFLNHRTEYHGTTNKSPQNARIVCSGSTSRSETKSRSIGKVYACTILCVIDKFFSRHPYGKRDGFILTRSDNC